jgi:hypothetical protein
VSISASRRSAASSASVQDLRALAVLRDAVMQRQRAMAAKVAALPARPPRIRLDAQCRPRFDGVDGGQRQSEFARSVARPPRRVRSAAAGARPAWRTSWPRWAAARR